MNKVILLAPTPPPIGGIAAWTVRMMNATLPYDWKVEVVDEKIIGKREFFGNNKRLNIKMEIKRCYEIWKGLLKSLKDKDAKVVHICIPANTLPVLRELVSACITKNRKRKLIVHFRCTVPNIVRGRINKFVLKVLCDKADCVMLLNKQSEEYIKTITKTHTVVIPNFVEEEEIIRHHEIREQIRKVLYIGGVVKSKGCLDIIEVAKSYPNIEFKLIGNPEDDCLIAARDVENVILEGTIPHEDIRKELMDADIFMFLTYFPGEGFSNSLAEAMASGLPCIVTDWAANKDMIENKGGAVVSVHGIKEVIDALDSMQSQEIRKKQGEFNIKKVIAEYTAEKVQRQYIECYKELLK